MQNDTYLKINRRPLWLELAFIVCQNYFVGIQKETEETQASEGG